MVRTLITVLLIGILSVGSTQNWYGSEATADVQFAAKTVDRPKMEVTIPVVVHVVWRTGEEQQAAERVASQIEVLNEDFRGLNTDLAQVHPVFQGITADMEINFVLATEDPQGQPHSGIIERQTSEADLAGFVGGRRRLCYNDLGGSTAWCTACYLNIWVADLNFNISGLAGIGIFPTQVADGEVPAEEDGVYIQYDRFGRGGELEAPYNLGRTCTHEIGHYLNLLHPWGTGTPPEICSDCCGDPLYDDFVEDTPFQVDTYFGECPGPAANSCDGGSDNVQNFMGFGTDNCALMFTEGQKARAWEALQTFRAGFLQEDCREACLVNSVTLTVEEPQLFAVLQNGTGLPRWEALLPDLRWELYLSNGQLVKSGYEALSGSVSWTLDDLADGLYFLRATHQGSWQTTKLLIARN